MAEPEAGLLRRGLRLTHLRLIAALSDSGQISAAAAALAISQPAASRLAAELEGVLGARLYLRHARGVALTEAGALFAARAKAALAQMRDAQRDLDAALSGGGGMVSIGAVTAPAVELLAPALHALRASHPEIEVTVQVETSAELIRALSAGRLDFAIGRIPQEMDPAGFDVRVIGPERACPVARRGHPLEGVAALDFARLGAFDWVMQPPGSPLRRAVEDAFLAEGAALPPRALNTASLIMTVATLRAGEAIAAVSEAVAAVLAGEGGPLTRLDARRPLVVPPFGLIRLKGAAPPPPARTVYAAVHATVAGMAPG